MLVFKSGISVSCFESVSFTDGFSDSLEFARVFDLGVVLALGFTDPAFTLDVAFGLAFGVADFTATLVLGAADCEAALVLLLFVLTVVLFLFEIVMT